MPNSDGLQSFSVWIVPIGKMFHREQFAENRNRAFGRVYAFRTLLSNTGILNFQQGLVRHHRGLNRSITNSIIDHTLLRTELTILISVMDAMPPAIGSLKVGFGKTAQVARPSPMGARTTKMSLPIPPTMNAAWCA